MSTDRVKLQVENLSKVFGPNPEEALRRHRAGATKDEIRAETASVVGVADVSFGVRAGEIFVVMGLSGSGKSTLVRCLNRLIEATEGDVLIDGESVTRADTQRIREIRLTRLAMVFQHFALFPHRTVGENVEYGLKIRGVAPDERREEADKALDLVGLEGWADAATEELSGGMQQRVGLARALAVDPEILLMDEPFSALDPLIRRDMQDELFALQRRLGVTVVFITHDLHEALRLGDHIAIMKEGRFVQIGTPQSIVAEPIDDYVREFVQDVDRGRVFSFGSIMRPASATLRTGDRVLTARQAMKARGARALLVVGGDGKPVGLVRESDLRGSLHDDAAIDDSVTRDVPCVRESDKLADGYEACSAGLPVAVVSGDGRLRGVVDPLDVLDSLGGAPPSSSALAG